MFYAHDVTLFPSRQDLRLLVLMENLQSAFLAARFSRAACAEILARASEGFGLTGLVDPAALLRGERFITEALLYPQPGDWRAILLHSDPERAAAPLVQPLDEGAVRSLGDWMRSAGHCAEPAHRARGVELLGEAAMGWLAAAPRASTPFRAPSGPGIYRREHASLLFSSREVDVLVDPISLQHLLPCVDQLSPEMPEVDAILITHGHFDHWHPPSLLHAARDPNVPVITPRIPRESVLCPERFEVTLSALGQRAMTPAWGEVLRVGDLEIEVLPFYGEQPTRGGPGPPADVRNWGNCYRIDTEDYSAVLLADSGTDPLGAMEDVLAQSRARRGPIDVVFACLRELRSPFHEGLPADLFTLPFAQLEALWARAEAGDRPSTTAGISGLPAICRAAGARAFYPYSNGFAGMYTPIGDIGWGGGEPTEAAVLKLLEGELHKAGVSTRVGSWLPDDRLVFTGREPSVAPRP